MEEINSIKSFDEHVSPNASNGNDVVQHAKVSELKHEGAEDVHNSDVMHVDNAKETGTSINNHSENGHVSKNLVDIGCHSAIDIDNQEFSDNISSVQSTVNCSNSVDSIVNNSGTQNAEAIISDVTNSNSINFNTVGSDNLDYEMNIKDNIALSDSSTELVLEENRSKRQDEVNGNAVANQDVECSSENSDEVMVIEDPVQINEATPNLINAHGKNIVVMDEVLTDSVVDAMNKDLLWKSDAAYKKDLSSLQLLCEYGSDSDEDNNMVENREKREENSTTCQTSNEMPAMTSANQEYRCGVETISDSDDETDSSEDEDTSSSTSTVTSSSSSEESDDSDNTSDNDCVIVEEKKPASKIPKTKGELDLDELPPIEDLHIDVPESECVEIGKVLNIVDSLVVVQSIKGCPALDLDSVLFLDHGHSTLGEVFDVFGKVGEACYCVRFNSKDHVLTKGVEPGMSVYYAPRTEYAKFVFLADLMKMKGSDASWEHNNEPPPKFLDYSDDEEERRARKGSKPPCREVEPDETQPRAKKFNKKAPQRGMGHASTSQCPSPNRPWATPFNRYPSPSPSPSLRFGPQPLIRPPSFQTPDHSESHFHNPAAGAPAVPAMPSPWAVPPPAVSNEFKYNTSMPPPHPHFVQNQMRQRDYGMNAANFGQPPQRQSSHLPPSSAQSRNFLMPTCIPGAGPFSPEALNSYRGDNQNSFTSSQPHFQGNPFRTNSQTGTFGADSQGPFGPQGPVFMNRNVPPPPPPPQGW